MLEIAAAVLVICAPFLPLVPFALPAPGMAFPFVWSSITDDDLLARMILSEAGGRVLTPDGQVDSVGIAWVALNRTLGLHPGFDYARNNLYSAITARGQFHGMAGAAAIVADPERASFWFGGQPTAGRDAYWIARSIARCVLSRRIADPTSGALFFSDARYARDDSGNLLHAPDGSLLTEPWPDGRTHFRPLPDAPSYPVEIIESENERRIK